jgi:hypothetical protein
MRRIIFPVIMVIFFSCKKDKKDISVSTAIDISYFDQNGNDLLDPNNPLSFKESDIDVFYLLDGVKVKQYQGNLEFPEFFFISDEIRENKHFMRLFPNCENLDENNRAVTYINFSNNLEDKVEGEFQTYAHSSSIRIIKVWYNDVLVWQNIDGGNPAWIEIIKSIRK